MEALSSTASLSLESGVIKGSHIKRLRWTHLPGLNLWWPCLYYENIQEMIRDLPTSHNPTLKASIFELARTTIRNPRNPVALL
eukprot:CAMPEP_0171306230 /NCGR_PEP_ID=MMETSP0816-20121228/16202_1 /TAXON_ID=420281 /ORGANISM="Proboscia inermis, Strain CCAP1064/1" /LENGTH=82 /DNA_ID=CAMNT_0011787665 /DNA_START=115 /DNA_END=360 /DNA_ORIENTATION=-